MKRVAFLLLMLATPIMAFCQYSKVSFYVAAHPDDWQLFIGANAFNNIKEASAGSDKKVVLIYVTAGEGNCDGAGIDTSYYQARMEAANRSVQFCADINSPRSTWSASVATMGGKYNHPIRRTAYKNIVSYYLLLPDGCFEKKDGTLTKLAKHSIASLDAIDSSTTYHGYKDLVETIRSILNKETQGAEPHGVSVYAQEWDRDINPRDHPDHMQTGNLAINAIRKLQWPLFLYSGYCTGDKNINLQTKDVASCAGLVSQIRSTMLEHGYDYGWDPGHTNHMLRSYYRRYKTVTDLPDVQFSELGYSGGHSASDTLITDNVYPNPSSSVVTISYQVQEASAVRILLYDATGKTVAYLRDADDAKGNYRIQYNISSLPAGTYVIAILKDGEIRHIKFEKR